MRKLLLSLLFLATALALYLNGEQFNYKITVFTENKFNNDETIHFLEDESTGPSVIYSMIQTFQSNESISKKELQMIEESLTSKLSGLKESNQSGLGVKRFGNSVVFTFDLPVKLKAIDIEKILIKSGNEVLQVENEKRNQHNDEFRESIKNIQRVLTQNVVFDYSSRTKLMLPLLKESPLIYKKLAVVKSNILSKVISLILLAILLIGVEKTFSSQNES